MEMPQRSAARLIIVCGLPGSGKTTLARSVEDAHGAIRFCPDDWMDALGINLHDQRSRARIEALQWTLAQQLLARGLIAIIEWGTWGRSERDALRSRARTLGASVELRYVTAPADVLFERVRRRARERPPIPQEVMDRWKDRFEVPTTDEMALYDSPLRMPSAGSR